MEHKIDIGILRIRPIFQRAMNFTSVLGLDLIIILKESFASGSVHEAETRLSHVQQRE